MTTTKTIDNITVEINMDHRCSYNEKNISMWCFAAYDKDGNDYHVYVDRKYSDVMDELDYDWENAIILKTLINLKLSQNSY